MNTQLILGAENALGIATAIAIIILSNNRQPQQDNPTVAIPVRVRDNS